MSSALIRFIEKVCVQFAWFWSPYTAVDDGFGGKTYTSPIIVKVRWTGKTQLIMDSNGKEVVSTGEILTPIDLPIGGIIQLLDEGNTVTLITGIPETELGIDYRLMGITVVWNASLPSPSSPDDGNMIIASSKVPLFMSTTEFVRTVFI